MSRIAAFLMALAAGAGLFSCASTEREPLAAEEIDPFGGAPSDFSVELTILSPHDVKQDVPAHLRQSRYVLFADGSLHSGIDADRSHGADWLPPLTRILSRGQVAELWALSSQLGFADPVNGLEPVNFKLVSAPANDLTYLAGFVASGERWCFIREGPVDQPPDQAMTQLARRLAELSWTSDQTPAEVRIVPKRYDFGPDPYVKYRKPAASK